MRAKYSDMRGELGEPRSPFTCASQFEPRFRFPLKLINGINRSEADRTIQVMLQAHWLQKYKVLYKINGQGASGTERPSVMKRTSLPKVK